MAFKSATINLGPFLPQTEGANTFARDLQFELNVAACCRESGHLIQSEEPDIVVIDPIRKFGIAVKRPKSTKTLEKHIRKGRDQIVRSGIDGILAIDLSLIYNFKNQIQFVECPEDTSQCVRIVSDNFIHKNSERIRRIVGTQKVFGIAVCTTSLFFIRSKHQFASATRWSFCNFCEMSDPRYEQLRKFAIRFAKNAH